MNIPSSFRPSHYNGGLISILGRVGKEYSPRFSVKITELTVLGLDFLGIDFRMVGQDILPPVLFLELLEMN